MTSGSWARRIETMSNLKFHAHNLPSRRRRLFARRLALLAAGALLVAALAAPTQAAASDRVFRGKAVHYAFDMAPDAEPYVTTFVVRANDKRITGIHVEVRLECLDPVSIIDLRYSKFLRRGPKLSDSGGFALTANGISVRGQIGKRRASGSIDGVEGQCKSPGARWTARRTSTL
jgi:hypothetical protein